MRRFTHLGLVLLLTIITSSGAARAAEPAGEVLALAGTCTADGASGHRVLAAGDPVAVGDSVAVAKDGRLKLRMADGSVLALAAGSRLTIKAMAVQGGDSRRAGFDLAAGLLRAVVSHMARPSSFEVGTATAVAAVRSTDWFIEATQAMTRVGVLTGRVTLTSRATGHKVEIPDRDGSRVEPGQDPIPAREWSQAEFDEYIARTALP